MTTTLEAQDSWVFSRELWHSFLCTSSPSHSLSCRSGVHSSPTYSNHQSASTALCRSHLLYFTQMTRRKQQILTKLGRLLYKRTLLLMLTRILEHILARPPHSSSHDLWWSSLVDKLPILPCLQPRHLKWQPVVQTRYQTLINDRWRMKLQMLEMKSLLLPWSGYSNYSRCTSKPKRLCPCWRIGWMTLTHGMQAQHLPILEPPSWLNLFLEAAWTFLLISTIILTTMKFWRCTIGFKLKVPKKKNLKLPKPYSQKKGEKRWKDFNKSNSTWQSDEGLQNYPKTSSGVFRQAKLNHFAKDLIWSGREYYNRWDIFNYYLLLEYFHEEKPA